MHSFPLPLVALLAGSAFAQCPFQSVSLQSNGQGCNPVFGTVPTYGVALDTSTCTLRVQVTTFAGCCNTFLVGRMLAIGTQPLAVPLPWLGIGCTLLVDPVIMLYQPTAAGDTFVLTLPPVVPPVALQAQGGAHYFTTIGLSHDFALTAGGQITLQ